MKCYNLKSNLLAVIMMVVICTTGIAQDDDPLLYKNFPTVEFSAKTELFVGDVPFHQRFILVIKELDPAVTQINVSIGKNDGSGVELWRHDVKKYGDTFTAVPDILLRPNRSYTFTIEYSAARLGGGNPNIETSFSTHSKFSDYVKLDFGLGYSDPIKGIFGVTGINISPVAVNRDADLGFISTMDFPDRKRYSPKKGFKGPIKQFFFRTSLYVGISPIMLRSDTKSPVKNFTGVGNIVYGIGWRSPFYGYANSSGAKAFLQPMRIVGGWIVFNQANSNVLIEKSNVKQTLYIGVTYDINLSKLLGPIGKLLSPS